MGSGSVGLGVAGLDWIAPGEVRMGLVLLRLGWGIELDWDGWIESVRLSRVELGKMSESDRVEYVRLSCQAM